MQIIVNTLGIEDVLDINPHTDKVTQDCLANFLNSGFNNGFCRQSISDQIINAVNNDESRLLDDDGVLIANWYANNHSQCDTCDDIGSYDDIGTTCRHCGRGVMQ